MSTRILRKWPSVVLCLAVVAVMAAHGYAREAKEPEMDNATVKAELLKKIDLYRNSIIHADDPAIAEQVWAAAPGSSFIHPRGHESGWEQIKRNFYGKTMAGTFSKRALTLRGEPVITVYGDAAVAEFDWDFVATMKDGGGERHTTGRESQVYANMPGSGWRLVHVHYSGPPTTAKGKGF